MFVAKIFAPDRVEIDLDKFISPQYDYRIDNKRQIEIIRDDALSRVVVMVMTEDAFEGYDYSKSYTLNRGILLGKWQSAESWAPKIAEYLLWQNRD